MVAVAVLQHQPEVSHKLCDALILQADKLLLHPPQAHGLLEPRLTRSADTTDTTLDLLMSHGVEEQAGKCLVLVQKKAREDPIGLLDLTGHGLLKVGGDTDFGERNVTVGEVGHAVIAGRWVVPRSDSAETVLGHFKVHVISASPCPNRT